METRLIEHLGNPYLETVPGSGLLAAEQDALDLVGECLGYGLARLLIHPANLPAAFYNLKTRLAGDVMLKFSNYRIRVAVIAPAEEAESGRFHEMMLETNRGEQFRIFTDRATAETWLTSG